MKIAFITPTKDRPSEIRKMLTSYMAQTHQPDQVIVVDASRDPVEDVIAEFPELNIDYKRWTKEPSAAAQRNGGLELLADDINLVCFFDDDQVLHKDAITRMVSNWSEEIEKQTKVSENHNTEKLKQLAAASFFDASWNDNRTSTLKKSSLSSKLGLYSQKPGGVAPSGWQSLYYGFVSGENLDVEWMSSQAIVLDRKVLEEFQFDEYFKGYSYLEDLDFSYSISRKYRMVVVADAKFDHFHSPSGRGSVLQFGKTEILNRLYFVKKHNLSIGSYTLAMFVRFLMSIFSGQFKRATGNVFALFQVISREGR